MDLRPKLQLQTMIKAMTDVVMPAIDPENDLAIEQAQLILGMMHLMVVRLPRQFEFDVNELERAVDLSLVILKEGKGGPNTQTALASLQQSEAQGRAILSAAKASPENIEQAILDLRSRTSALIDALSSDGESACQTTISRAVLESSQEQIALERAWFAPQGWDTKEDAPESLEKLLPKRPLLNNESIRPGENDDYT